MPKGQKGVYRFPDIETEIHFCKCECGQRIIFKPRYRIYGYPKYLQGHEHRGRTATMYPYIARAAEKRRGLRGCRYPNAPNEIHFCTCGCGGQILFRPKFRYIGYPKYLYQHGTRGRTKENDAGFARMAEKKRGQTKDVRYPNAPNEIHLCECGCEKQILFRPKFRYIGYPKYLSGHNGRGHTKETHPYLAAMAERKRGRTKDNDAGYAALSEKLTGRTKATHPYLATMAEKISGDKSPNWQGGISFEPYTPDFNKALKQSIRQRDGYKCQLCGVPEAECTKKLTNHHIDYVKANSDPSNLIALCTSCNAKVNTNRTYWTRYFQRKMRLRKFKVLISWLPTTSRERQCVS